MCVSKVAFTFRLEQTRLSLSPLLQAAGCKRVLGSWSREKGKVHWPKQLKLHPGNRGWFPRKLHGVGNIVYIDYFANLAPTCTKLWFLIFRLCLWNNQLFPVKEKEKKKQGRKEEEQEKPFPVCFLYGKKPLVFSFEIPFWMALNAIPIKTCLQVPSLPPHPTLASQSTRMARPSLSPML